MNKLLIDNTTQEIEWDIQSGNFLADGWKLEELYSSAKVVTTASTYKIVSLDDTITYAEVPIQATIIKYI